MFQIHIIHIIRQTLVIIKNDIMLLMAMILIIKLIVNSILEFFMTQLAQRKQGIKVRFQNWIQKLLLLKEFKSHQ